MDTQRRSVKLLDLEGNRFFEDFSKKEASELGNVSVVQTYAVGEYVLRENDTSRDFFIILSGRVSIGKTLYAGDEKELVKLGPGEFFGEMSFLNGDTRSANASCIEESTILCMDRDSFEKLAAKNPGIAYKVIIKIANALADRLRKSNEIVEDIFSNPNKAILELKTRLIRIQTMLGR